MARKGMSSWAKENIPNDATLYMRVHKHFLDDQGQPTPGVFRNHNGGMSADWNKYSIAQESLNRAKRPSENGMIEMVAGDIRTIPYQAVEHTPDSENDNRAHSDVFGEKDTEVRLKFTRIFKWAIRFDG